jgi:hypothetical protein
VLCICRSARCYRLGLQAEIGSVGYQDHFFKLVTGISDELNRGSLCRKASIALNSQIETLSSEWR